MNILISTTSGKGIASINAYLLLSDKSIKIDKCYLLIPNYFSKETALEIKNTFNKNQIDFEINTIRPDKILNKINEIFCQLDQFKHSQIYIDVTSGDRKIAYSLIVSAQFYRKNIQKVFFIHIPESNNRSLLLTELNKEDYEVIDVPMFEDLEFLEGEVQIVNSEESHTLSNPELWSKILSETGGYEILRDYAFKCPYCRIRNPRLDLRWSNRTNSFHLICPSCKKEIKGLRKGYNFPILLNYVVLDTCVLESGAALRIAKKGYFDGYCIVIPNSVLNELEYHEKDRDRPNMAKLAAVAFRDLKKIREMELREKKFRLIELGEGLTKEDYEIINDDKGLVDRKIAQVAKQYGAILITADEKFANRATAKGINVIYVEFN